jgi:hypothetical protein
MTLKDKLKTTVSINTDGEAGRFANRCTEIADDYAIEFANWCEWQDGKAFKTFQELLEIFKKEKGL